MKVLLVGDWQWPWYQQACAEALAELGCTVIKFGWLDAFKKWVSDSNEPVYRSLSHRIQYRLLQGPTVWRINRDLVRTARAERPDIVWCYNAQLILPATVRRIRYEAPAAILCQYANDNPFSDAAAKGMWRHFVASVPYFHRHFSYRHSNIPDYHRYGAARVDLLRSYFVPRDDFPLPRERIDPNFKCDVVFAGHYESDGRVELLEAICQAGFALRIYGGGWQAALPKLGASSPLRALFPIKPVVGDEYRQAICGAKVALCFLSTLNQDTYTRRNFQIPAMRVAMLSQRTSDLQTLFEDNKEAMFFDTAAELLAKLRMLVNDDGLRERIARAGYERVHADGHDVRSRMQQWLQLVRT